MDAALRTALPAFVLLAFSTAPALPAAGCFRACVGERITSADDDVAMRDAMRACRDLCVQEERDGLRAEGLYEPYADCRPTPLTREEFQAVRSANASFTVQINVLVWELRNPLPDKVIRTVEVGTQTMSLGEAVFTAATLIPPDHVGTVVVMDFFDGYPAARFANKLTGIGACPVR